MTYLGVFQQPFKNIRQKDKMKVNLRIVRITN